MAVTNWTIITRRKDNGKVVTFPLLSKWTYKTAIAVIVTGKQIGRAHV